MAEAADKKKASGLALFWDGVKAEFGKISWPDRKATFKQSVAVVAVSLIAGVLIAALDFLIQIGVNWLTAL